MPTLGPVELLSNIFPMFQIYIHPESPIGIGVAMEAAPVAWSVFFAPLQVEAATEPATGGAQRPAVHADSHLTSFCYSKEA